MPLSVQQEYTFEKEIQNDFHRGMREDFVGKDSKEDFEGRFES